jgi:hypothetical protein
MYDTKVCRSPSEAGYVREVRGAPLFEFETPAYVGAKVALRDPRGARSPASRVVTSLDGRASTALEGPGRPERVSARTDGVTRRHATGEQAYSIRGVSGRRRPGFPMSSSRGNIHRHEYLPDRLMATNKECHRRRARASGTSSFPSRAPTRAAARRGAVQNVASMATGSPSAAVLPGQVAWSEP